MRCCSRYSFAQLCTFLKHLVHHSFAHTPKSIYHPLPLCLAHTGHHSSSLWKPAYYQTTCKMLTEKYTMCNRENNDNKDVEGIVFVKKVLPEEHRWWWRLWQWGQKMQRERKAYLRERERGRFMGDRRPSSSIEGLLSPDEKWREWEWRTSSTAGEPILKFAPPAAGPVVPPLAPTWPPIWCSLSWLEHCDCKVKVHSNQNQHNTKLATNRGKEMHKTEWQ